MLDILGPVLPMILRRALLAAPLLAVPIAAFAAPETFATLEVATGSRIGVAGIDTGSGALVAHRADERFPLCSTFKVMAACDLLARSVTDPALLGRTIQYSRADLLPYSPITSQHLGTGLTVAELCAAALDYSDNTAANLLLRQLGGPVSLTGYARSIGDSTFRLDRWETALNEAIPGDPRDTSTPLAMAAILRRALLGNLLAAAQRAQLVSWMVGCTTGLHKIRAAAPIGAIVADKTGGGDYGAANDVAVIWPPGRAPIVLAIYTTMPSRAATGRDETLAAAAVIALRTLG